jgi:DNA-binding transcriptional LysR family regulator
MYTPQRRPNLEVLHLMDERLVLVTSAADLADDGGDYIHVDWGPEFYAQYNAHFPDFAGPALSVNIGWLGLQHLLRSGGSGYFPYRLVRAAIAKGRLRAVADAPEFILPAYLVHGSDRRDTQVSEMREAIFLAVSRLEA